MLSFRKKDDEELRMHFAAPSFFASIGKDCTAETPRDARLLCERESPCSAVFIPSPQVFSAPRAWASALSSASYLVVIGDARIRAFSSFMGLLDGIVFSPAPRKLSSAFIVQTRDEALALIEGAGAAYPSVLTIRASGTGDQQ